MATGTLSQKQCHLKIPHPQGEKTMTLSENASYPREYSSERFVSVPLKNLALILFFLSGISGLIYEVVWVRMLTLSFGNTVYAIGTVLASFMAGLAIGSFLFGRYVEARKNPFRIYGILQICTGIVAMGLTFLFTKIDSFYADLYRTFANSEIMFTGARTAFSFLLLVLPTLCMGGTFPVMAKHFVRRESTIGFNIAILYYVNTLGAVVGCFAAGFLLIGFLGLMETIYIAVVFNLAIGLIALFASGRTSIVDHRTEGHQPDTIYNDYNGAGVREDDTETQDLITPSLQKWILAAFALSGFTALGYEVLWSKALTFFLGNSTYAFSTMLTTFLCGIALGSAFIARYADRRKDLILFFALLEILIGITAVLTIPTLGRFLYAIGTLWPRFASAYWGNPFIKFLKAFIVMFIPTFLMGCAFPLVCKIYSRGVKTIGKRVGEVYALNTVGCILGATLTCFVFISLFGLHHSIALISLVNILIGFVFLMYSSGLKPSLKIALIAIALVSLGFSNLAAFKFRFRNIEDIEETELHFYYEHPSGIVKVFTDTTGNRKVSINGWIVAGTGNLNDLGMPEIQKFLGHLPMFLHRNAEDILIIGFGAGGTSYAFSCYDGVKSIDCCEFTRGIIMAAPYLDEVNHGVMEDPRFRIIFNDGRNHMLLTDKKYDVISIDAIDPKHAGSSNLYSKEFYELCHRTLRDDGIMVEWLPYHQVNDEDCRMIVKGFVQVFPHSSLWFTRFKSYAVIVGSKKPLDIDYGLVVERLEQDRVRKDLGEIYMTEPALFLDCYGMGRKTLWQYASAVDKVSSDYYPYIEFYGFDWHVPHYENLYALTRTLDPVFPRLVNDTGVHPDSLRAFTLRHYRKSGFLIKALLQYDRRNTIQAYNECLNALSIVPGDEGIHFLLKTTPAHIELFGKTIAKNPANFISRAQLGFAHMVRGQKEHAIAQFEESVALEPGYAFSNFYLAECYREKGWLDNALHRYQMSLECDDRGEFSHFAQNGIQLSNIMGDLNRNPRDGSLWKRLGHLYEERERWDLAIEAYKKWATLEGANEEVYVTLAENFEDYGMWAKAKDFYEQAMALNPRNDRIHMRLKRIEATLFRWSAHGDRREEPKSRE
jgi:spermidine synthase